MGGYDLIQHTIWYTPDSTMPAWGLLFTFPFRWLSYPAVWYTWSAICVVLVGWCMWIFGTKTRLWLVVLSWPMLAGLWYGQPEALILVGVALGWLTLERKVHPVFMGIAWMLMLIKPQITLLPVLLFVGWMWQDKRPGSLFYAIGAASAIFILSAVIWPQWIPNYAEMSMTYIAPDANASIWPWGLSALPLILWPDLSRMARLRVALAINLVAAPYIMLYHSIVALAVSGSLVGILISLPIIKDARLAWIIPAMILTHELVKQYETQNDIQKATRQARQSRAA